VKDLNVAAYLGKLDRALKLAGSLHTFEDILDGINNHTMQSFAEDDTWIITQIQEYPRRRVLDILYLVGDLDGALNVYNRIIAFARERGCTLIRAQGRAGWTKFADEDGWMISHAFCKELIP